MSRHEGPTHTSAPPKLPATLRLGAVHLSVSDVERSVDFYEDAIGLRVHHREDSVAAQAASATTTSAATRTASSSGAWLRVDSAARIRPAASL